MMHCLCHALSLFILGKQNYKINYDDVRCGEDAASDEQTRCTLFFSPNILVLFDNDNVGDDGDVGDYIRYLIAINNNLH